MMQSLKWKDLPKTIQEQVKSSVKIKMKLWKKKKLSTTL